MNIDSNPYSSLMQFSCIKGACNLGILLLPRHKLTQSSALFLCCNIYHSLCLCVNQKTLEINVKFSHHMGLKECVSFLHYMLIINYFTFWSQSQCLLGFLACHNDSFVRFLKNTFVNLYSWWILIQILIHHSCNFHA